MVAMLAASAWLGLDPALADDATFRYVADQGEDDGDCTLPVRPCRTIWYALSVAGKHDQVRIARGTYKVPSVEDVAYLIHGTIDVKGGFNRFDHFLISAPARNQTTLAGVPVEFRDQLRARGFHVIVDQKGLDDTQRTALGAMGASAADVACVDNTAGAHACDNVDLLSHVPLGDMSAQPLEAADIWGFVDLNTGREYAIIGLRNGIATFDVTDPEAPFEVGHVSGLPSEWRDAKVLQRFDSHRGRWQTYAYISTDAGGQLVVVDLTGLPNRVALGQQLSQSSIHNVYVSNVDYATGVPVDAANAPPSLHVLGGYDNSGAFVSHDLTDPLNPRLIARSTGGYSHDATSILVTDDRAEACGSQRGKCEVLIDFNEESFDLWDLSNRTAPRLLSSTTYTDAAYVHSGWWTEDGLYLIVHDEKDERHQGKNTTVRVFSLADLENPVFAGSWTGTTAAVDHNGYAARQPVLHVELFSRAYRAGHHGSERTRTGGLFRHLHPP